MPTVDHSPKSARPRPSPSVSQAASRLLIASASDSNRSPATGHQHERQGLGLPGIASGPVPLVSAVLNVPQPYSTPIDDTAMIMSANTAMD